MLENRIVIEEDTFIQEDLDIEEGKVSTWINILHHDLEDSKKLDGTIYTMYEGRYLDPIQVYGIIKSIIEIYETHSIHDFIKHIRNMAVQFTSASMQINPKSKKNILLKMEHQFKYIKTLTAEQEDAS